MWKKNFWNVTFEGIPLDGFRALARLDRGQGKFQLVPHHRSGWVLVFMPLAHRSGRGWYLQAEKSGKIRVFARIDSAVRVAKTLPYAGGLYVRWAKNPEVIVTTGPLSNSGAGN
jgi:hypothetical protein